LGTHLDISAYPGDRNLDVTLYEGKVELIDTNLSENKVVMKPGERTSFSIQDRNFYVENTVLEKPAEWRDGVMRFYNEDLNTISKKLERKFMTRIFISDEEVGKLSFTGSFDKENLDKILNLLSKAHEFKTIKTSNGIIIKSLKNNI
jgi:ferric-dicitrate binding protein FerR (iron transport regulator)